RERITWSRVQVTYEAKPAPPRLVHEGDGVKLTAGQVCLSLGIPEGGVVLSEVADHVAVRRARVYSLVVNRRGDQYVEVVTVCDFEGEVHVEKRPCEITVVADDVSSAVSKGVVRMLNDI